VGCNQSLQCCRLITNLNKAENNRRTQGSASVDLKDNLPQGPIDKAVKDFSKQLKARVEANGGHFKYSKCQCNDMTMQF